MKVTFAQRKLFASIRHFSLAVVSLAAFLSLLIAPVPAAAVTVPLVFDGPENTFDGSLDLSGNLFANGSGSVFNSKYQREEFKFKAPFNHPLSSSFGVVPISSTLKSSGPEPTGEVSPSGLVTSIGGLDLDLLNGQTADFAIDSVFMSTNSSLSLLKVGPTFNLSGTLTALQFAQTGSASITGAGFTGNFSIPGTLSGNIDNLLMLWAGLLEIPGAPTFHLSIPFNLNGTWTTSGPPSDTKIALDGNFDAALPLSLHTNFNTIISNILSLTYSSTMDLTASLLITGSYHLETTVVIPEPGSIALLVVGLAALAPLARRRLGRY